VSCALGVVFTDGTRWQEQRRFSTRHLRNLGLAGDAMERIISEEVEDLVQSIHKKFNETEVCV
jgi:methyl farnesoate epoxidase/farnesoate epoxidase